MAAPRISNRDFAGPLRDFLPNQAILGSVFQPKGN
jgi:hypothetical protein